MNREFLFTAKRKSDGVWVEGAFIPSGPEIMGKESE